MQPLQPLDFRGSIKVDLVDLVDLLDLVDFLSKSIKVDLAKSILRNRPNRLLQINKTRFTGSSTMPHRLGAPEKLDNIFVSVIASTMK